MSTYLEFFVKKSEDEKFVPIFTFGRSHFMSVAFESFHIPWEKIRRVDMEFLDAVKDTVCETIEECKKSMARNDEMKEDMLATLHDYEAVREAWDDWRSQREYLEEEIENSKAALVATGLLKNILWESNVELYVGYEVGAPTMEDIV